MPIRPENKKRYPADWKAISQHVRFVRAGGVCECEGECGLGHHGRCPNVHGEPSFFSGSTVILTTAHLNHTPEVCGTEQDPYCYLKAMCQGCHLHYDKDHHAQTRRRNLEKSNRAAGQLPMFAMLDLQALEPNG
jgi:hypothetical protein